MLMRYGMCLLLSWYLLDIANAAAPPCVVDINSKSIPLGLHLDYLKDKNGELSLEQVTSPTWQKQFVTSTSVVPNFGWEQSVYWFRLVIDNQLSKDKKMFLNIQIVTPKTLDVYIQQADSWQHTQAGLDLPFQQRPLALKDYMFPVHLKANQQQEVYIRLNNAFGTNYLPAFLMTAEQLAIGQYEQSWFPAFLYGALGILVIYNLFIFFSTRSNIYLYYIVFNVLFILVDMQMRGYSFQYFWPNWPALNYTFGIGVHFVYQAFFLLLTQKLLELKRYSGLLNRIMSFYIAFVSLCAFATFILPSAPIVSVLSITVLIYPLLALFVSVYVWRQKGSSSSSLLIGWGGINIATFILILSTRGILPLNFWTGNVLQVSILLFSVIASLALANRINVLRAERQAAQKKALQEVQEKQRIAEQNLQLQNDNVRMSAELDVARKLQTMVLPSPVELRQVQSLDIACWMEPADEIGGDYYDVLQYQDKVIIGMGDVVGHGLASGVLMIMVQTAVRALSISNSSSTDFFRVLNLTIYENIQRMGIDKSLTLVMLDYQQGRLSISGQHEEVLIVRRSGELEQVDTFDLGFMIGIEPNIDKMVNVYNVELESGDGIVLYTDGITEAFDRHRKQYGLDRLCEITCQHWSKPARDIKNAVLKDFHQYVGERSILDDCTLMVVKQLAN